MSHTAAPGVPRSVGGGTLARRCDARRPAPGAVSWEAMDVRVSGRLAPGMHPMPSRWLLLGIVLGGLPDHRRALPHPGAAPGRRPPLTPAGELVPLSDFGPAGGEVRSKAWGCTDPGSASRWSSAGGSSSGAAARPPRRPGRPRPPSRDRGRGPAPAALSGGRRAPASAGPRGAAGPSGRKTGAAGGRRAEDAPPGGRTTARGEGYASSVGRWALWGLWGRAWSWWPSWSSCGARASSSGP